MEKDEEAKGHTNGDDEIDSTRMQPKNLVFLGGSCNPTNWRNELVLPMLQQWGISYVNAQIEKWKEDCIEIENEAKKKSKYMFYVVSHETRSIVTIIEASNFIGLNTELILTVFETPFESWSIRGEEVVSREQYLLNGIRNLLIFLGEKNNIPIHRNISHAMNTFHNLLYGGKVTSPSNQIEPSKINDLLIIGDQSLTSNAAKFCDENNLKKFSWIDDILTEENFHKIFDQMMQSQTLLFLLEDESRHFDYMIMAAFAIGRQMKVIVFVQNPQSNQDDNEKLSEIAAEDFIRGWLYFLDIVKQSNVPIFYSLHDALLHAKELCNNIKP